MRIIAGSAKGTRLHTPGKMEVRPTLDRVRETLFNILMPRIEGSRLLDAFAGTGAIGLEALSRGADAVTFVEPELKVQELIRDNIEKCHLSEADWSLLSKTASQAIRTLEQENRRFDLVYVDPPFFEELYEQTLDQLVASTLLDEEAWVVVEHFHKTELQGNYGRLTHIREKRLGDTRLSFFSFNPSS